MSATLPDPQDWCRPREATRWRWRARFWCKTRPLWAVLLAANTVGVGLWGFWLPRPSWLWVAACFASLTAQIAFAWVTSDWHEGEDRARQLEAEHRLNLERLNR